MAKQKPATRTSQIGSGMFIERAADVVSDDETSSTESSGPLTRHPEFFFDNTLIAIQAGKTLFNVHKYQLAKSEVFSDRFKQSKSEGDEPEEGSSPERPIKLKGVSASDFAALLKVLYASHFSSNQPAPEAPLIIPAFRLANLFKFSELRAFLLPLAEKNLDDVDKIVFSREFDIKEWVVPAHIRLCEREKYLSGDEARKLGVESVLIISRMRELHRSRGRSQAISLMRDWYYCYACAGQSHTGGHFSTHNSSPGECPGCRSDRGPGFLLYTGPDREVQNNASTADNTKIKEGMKKWVEGGCITKD